MLAIAKSIITMNQSNSATTGIIFVLLGALAIGIMPSAAKVAYQEGANPMAAIVVRSLIGVVGIGIYMKLTRIRFGVGWNTVGYSSFSGAMQSLSSLGIMFSLAYMDVSLAVLIIFCFPFIVAAFTHFSGSSKISGMVLLCFCVAMVGLSLVLGVKGSSVSLTGIMFAVIGMVSTAAMVLTVAKLSSRIGPIPANFFMTGWTSLYFLIVVAIGPLIGLIDEPALPETVRGWVALFGVGVSFTLGYVLFFIGAAIIGSTRASMLSIMEPVLIILTAMLLIDERLSSTQWVGLILVIVSLMIIELPGRKRPKK